MKKIYISLFLLLSTGFFFIAALLPDSALSFPAITVISHQTNRIRPYKTLYPLLYQKNPTSHIRPKPKTAYLTFDDGPSDTTKEVLKILNQNQIHATFFVIGNCITKSKEKLVRSMIQQGHLIGIHTYSHECQEIYRSVDAYLKDFDLAYEKLLQVTGKKPSLFRFPGGSINDFNRTIYRKLIAEMERRGFCYYDWNVSAEDSVGRPTATSILKNIFHNLTLYDEPVILMHDSSTNQLTAQLLPQIIKRIRQKGYTFDTLNHRTPCQFGKSRS